MKKNYETLSVDVVKFEAQDVITSSFDTDTSENENSTGNPDGVEEIPADR